MASSAESHQEIATGLQAEVKTFKEKFSHLEKDSSEQQIRLEKENAELLTKIEELEKKAEVVAERQQDDTDLLQRKLDALEKVTHSPTIDSICYLWL